ncbi:MAG: hypothetical protein AVDCRST_MAG27-2056, partial [uncultured Craurococcus sp.]
MRGFQVIPRRAAGESTFARLGQAPRLARGFERPPEVGEAMMHAAMACIMFRRLAPAA